MKLTPHLQTTIGPLVLKSHLETAQRAFDGLGGLDAVGRAVDARSMEPLTTFRVAALDDDIGVDWILVANAVNDVVSLARRLVLLLVDLPTRFLVPRSLLLRATYDDLESLEELVSNVEDLSFG